MTQQNESHEDNELPTQKGRGSQILVGFVGSILLINTIAFLLPQDSIERSFGDTPPSLVITGSILVSLAILMAVGAVADVLGWEHIWKGLIIGTVVSIGLAPLVFFFGVVVACGGALKNM